MRLSAARPPRLAALGAAAVGCLRQFIARIVDDIPGRMRRRNKRLEDGNAIGKHDDRNQQHALENP